MSYARVVSYPTLHEVEMPKIDVEIAFERLPVVGETIEIEDDVHPLFYVRRVHWCLPSIEVRFDQTLTAKPVVEVSTVAPASFVVAS